MNGGKSVHLVIELFNQYGYIVLLIALMLELVAFPLPGEALMTYCGYVVYEHKMNLIISIMIAAIGASAGITLSHFLGKALGMSFFEKYGHLIHLDKKRLDKISIWFNKYGNRLLIVAYFIPGIRHITGYFSGIIKIPYKKFAVNAYVGALLWTATFILLGKVFGPDWEKYHRIIKKYLIIGGLIAAVILLGVYLYKSNKERINDVVFEALDKGLKIFHSLGRIKIAIAGIAGLFIVFFALVIGIIQDYLGHEFSEFDATVKYLAGKIFDMNWANAMKLFMNLSDIPVLLIVIFAAAIWILVAGTNKFHEIRFLAAAFIGTELADNILKIAFHRVGPSGAEYSFPSSQVLAAVVVYGYFAYMVVRHNKKSWVNYIAIGLWMSICFLTGLSMIYFNIQYPSDVAAGLEFGVLWLSLCIILMEVYRVLPDIKTKGSYY